MKEKCRVMRNWPAGEGDLEEGAGLECILFDCAQFTG